MDFSINKYPVYFINLRNIDEDGLMFYLTKIIFYEKPEFINFHYNTNDNERSLLISEDSFEIIKPILDKNSVAYTKRYYCAYITNTYGMLDDTGLVRKLSTDFAEAKIPILYITTYNNNFILFDEDFYDCSIKLLKSISDSVHFC